MMFLWLLLSVLAFGAGEYLSKKWSLQPSPLLALLLVLPYMAGTWLWLPALKAGKNLATTGITWSVMSAAATVGIGIVLFHEKLNVYNYIGILFSVLGLVLLQIKG
jgi:multidrug transporter EmrE-like cation transporter